ncbi:MAG: laccase domain-containing protein, partial [Thermomicrobiales bacterium]
NTIRTMMSVFHVEPGEILAFIGPAICRDCYEVGPEVERGWRQIDPHDDAGAILRSEDGTTFDLLSANRHLLTHEGVPAVNIEESGLCTRCHGDQWFTHRGQGPRTGRFGAIIALDESC